jgi:outer membrane protein assembly factor BamA
MLIVAGMILFPKTAVAQKTMEPDSAELNYVIIRRIIIEGNRRTRERTILREVTFNEGDSVRIDELMEEVQRSRNQVQNTGLFNEVNTNIRNWVDDSLDVELTVKERWYTIPVPALDLYDRNFNVWWFEHDHDLRWIQAGVRLYQNNLTGRNDNLKMAALFGFKQTLALDYTLPYFDAVQKHGFHLNANYSRSRNITYDIAENKELIHEDVNAYQRASFNAAADVFYRPGFHYTYTLTAGYRYSKVTDTVVELNPNYFGDTATTQQYVYARFLFVRDYRDIIAYPLKGNYLDAALVRLGFGLLDDVNLWQLYGGYSHYVDLGKKWYLSSQSRLKISFPGDQPYSLARGLGYGNEYVAGYEYYAIDGQSWALTKLNLKNQIFRFDIPTPGSNPFTKGARLPFIFYGRVYVDAGYVWDQLYFEDNPLDNSFLLGGGVAIDMLLIYDTTLRFEYSINKLGEHGLFFHVNTLF